MPRKTMPLTALPEDFELTARTIETVSREHPTIDIPATLEKFRRKADALGWMYKSWQSAFLNYCDNGQKYGGVEFKQGRAQDPRWTSVLNEARKYSFRMPEPQETPDSYRTKLNQFIGDKDTNERNRSSVVNLVRNFGS